MSNTPQEQAAAPVAETLAKETRRKKRLFASALWPQAWLIVQVLKQRIDEEETFEQAAALTYKTLFSLLPIFVLALVILSALSPSQPNDGIGPKNVPQDKSRLDSMVETMIIEELQLNKLHVVDRDGNETLDEYGDPVTLVDTVKPVLEKAKKAVTTPATGLIAFTILLYGAVSLMVVIEGAFNQIYGVIKGRSWARRAMLYWSVLTLGPIGVAASLVLGGMAFQMAGGVTQISWLLVPLNIVMGFCVSWTLVMLMYKLIPETQVKWKSAAFGAFLAALLWELGKLGFGIYVKRSVGSSYYGSLVLVPLFMMWIYLTWSFILLGLQVSYVHQHWRMLRRRFFFTKFTPVPMTDLRWALSLGVLLYQRFRTGKPLVATEAAEQLMMPNEIAAQLLNGFAQAGLVHRVKDQSYALARPPEDITAHDLLTAARALCQAPPEIAKDMPMESTTLSPAMVELDALETAWAKSHALPRLAGN